MAARKLGLPKPARIGVYPETKHPTYFDSCGLRMDRPLLRALAKYGYEGRNAPVFVQSFEVGNLMRLRTRTKVPMVQLIEATGAPYDFVASRDSRTYAELDYAGRARGHCRVRECNRPEQVACHST